MKAIALLAALLAFALPAKAEVDSKLAETKAYFFGFIYGSGPTLYGVVQDEEITKDYANYFLSELVEELSKRVQHKDVKTILYRALIA